MSVVRFYISLSPFQSRYAEAEKPPMLKVDNETLKEMEEGYPGILEEILDFENAELPSCPMCKSDNTANVQVGIIQRTINLIAATTKVKLIPNGPKPGPYYCWDCKKYFNPNTND